jgi:tRNA(fMet)-specific endonuclease VapC
MTGRVLLDTNVVIALFEQERSAQDGLSRVEDYYVPSIVLGELYYGAEWSGRPKENVTRTDRFAAASKVLVPDAESARQYGAIRNALRGKGKPIPDNDIWIAAIARQHSLTLIARDAHVREIEGLTTENWP